jgi:simple sugar transport system permease protein
MAEVAGPIGQLRPQISPGYGFTAIIVAFLGRLNPLGVVDAALLLALTNLGGEAAQVTLQLSDKVTRVFQGLLLIMILATDTLINYRIRFRPAPAGGAAQAARDGARV